MKFFSFLSIFSLIQTSVFALVSGISTRQCIVSSLYIRSSPGTSSTILGSYSKCDVITMVGTSSVVANNYNWIKVLWKGKYAYTATGLVSGGDVRVAYYPATLCNGVKLRLPLNHGTEAGYSVDTGLDIAVPKGTSVYAAASGYIVYSEYGHTSWTTPPDTPYSILIKLDKPFTYSGRTAYYIWYTHMSSLRFSVKDGSALTTRINAGDFLGYSGIANNNAHLHFGVVINRSQATSNDYFTVAQVRGSLGLIVGQNF
jgi:hypothetical protein